jgi:excisionase family DNA binding protein
LATAEQQLSPLLTIEEVSHLLGISRTTCYRLADAGELRAIRLGSGPKPRLRFEVDAVKRFLNAHRAELRA